MPRVLICYEKERIRKTSLKCERLELQFHVHYEEIQMLELNLDTTRHSLLIRNSCGGRELPRPWVLLPLKDYANTSLVSAEGSCVQQIHNNYSFLFLVSFKKSFSILQEHWRTIWVLGVSLLVWLTFWEEILLN